MSFSEVSLTVHNNNSTRGAEQDFVASASFYVPGADGTRLAVDVWLPIAQPAPAIVVFTRYWRSFAAPGPSIATNLQPIVSHFSPAGYAVVIVDVRGTGASFGSRETEWSHAEVRDFGAVFDWITAQPWSNGRIATIGTSYGGNTAELAVLTRHPSLRAVVPRFSDFTEYQHAFFPGGLRNNVIAEQWLNFVTTLDANDPRGALSSRGPDSNPQWREGVRPVNGDKDALRAAVREHQGNTDLREIMARMAYCDDPFGPADRPEVTLEAISPSSRVSELANANVPSMHWASWFDGGTADGALTRFLNYRGPMQVIIGAWNHGGNMNADPFVPNPGGEPEPSVEEQHRQIQQFLDPLLWPDRPGVLPRQVKYLVLGKNEWRTTEHWPPDGSRPRPFYLQAGARLAVQPADSPETDVYQVDFSASTGPNNRWTTQLGARVDYGDRRDADRQLLLYSSEPLAQERELTGTPVLQARLKSSRSDGALFAYLESVAPDGRVTYLTDGVLRLRFNEEKRRPTAYKQHGTMPGFTRAEADVIVPGEWFTVRFSLNPLSVHIPPGYRIRLALAGADRDTFEQRPAHGRPPELVFLCGGPSGSFIELPVVQPTGRRS